MATFPNATCTMLLLTIHRWKRKHHGDHFASDSLENPAKSIAIPTIAGSSYSPDFMYVVQKADGKELNIIVETKDRKQNRNTRRGAKINSAKEFSTTNLDGYDVKYVQLNKS